MHSIEISKNSNQACFEKKYDDHFSPAYYVYFCRGFVIK